MRVLASVAVVMVLAGCANADPERTRLTAEGPLDFCGTVVDDGGARLENVSVGLRFVEPFTYQMTDGDGRFCFRDLAHGTYQLRLARVDYNLHDAEVVHAAEAPEPVLRMRFQP